MCNHYIQQIFYYQSTSSRQLYLFGCRDLR
jgi:hypothetical protein